MKDKLKTVLRMRSGIKYKKVEYTNIDKLFKNIPNLKDQYVIVKLDKLNKEDYKKLANCYNHMKNGEINIEDTEIKNTKKIPINEGMFSKIEKKFKPNVFYKGLIESQKTYLMTSYNLDYSKLEVINGRRIKNYYIEDQGKTMQIFYAGLEIAKKGEGKLTGQTDFMIDLYKTDKVF